ncbi:MAG: sugar ABC transporter permease [Ardenticatenaceae bacterium]
MIKTKDTTSTSQASQEAFQSDRNAQSMAEYIGSYLKRVRSGDLGSLPIILGIIMIALIFQSQNENYLTPRNFVNLIVQMAGITTMAIGVVYVLLLGEIDLSIGYVSAVGGVSMTLLLGGAEGWPWYLAIPAALGAVAVVGLLQGLIITQFQVPSFVVTLAGLLAWNGVVLILVGRSGTIIIQDQVVIGIANYYLPTAGGWAAAALLVAAYGLNQIRQMQGRKSQGLSTKPIMVVGLEVLFLAILAGGAVYIANQDRGVPFVGLLLILLLAGFSFIATRTQFGRYVYAVGGNKEAARRAGIAVERIRIAVFMISSVMAGMGGIILASRLRSVATDAGGGNLLLNAIAAAVIGGTSLFGGSGHVSSALLGALVIASVENGMGLLGLSSGVKFIITGLVLLVAVLVDSLSRRSRARSGIA